VLHGQQLGLRTPIGMPYFERMRKRMKAQKAIIAIAGE